MHHVKNDKRCLKTAEIVYDSLLRLLNRKNIDDITVTDISNDCHISRSTFYRNFDEPIDVLIMECEAEFEAVFDSYIEKCHSEANEYRNYTFLLHFFSEFAKDGRATETLIKMDKFDSVYKAGLKKSQKMSELFFSSQLEGDDDYDYFISIRAGLSVSLLATWMSHDRKKTVPELMEILKLSGNLGKSEHHSL